MAAFNFDLSDDNGECLSKTNITCSYNDGMFYFDGFGVMVGNSGENNSGGIGGFVGPNHEYFLYCGSEYAEIAIVKLKDDTGEWKDHGGLQWFALEPDGHGFFENIWFTHNDLALIFEPREKYRSALMQHEDPTGKRNCIKLDLSRGKFTSLTQEQFVKQRHSVVDKDSKWPHSSKRTLVETPRPLSTQQTSILDIVENTKAEVSACLDEALRLINDHLRCSNHR